MAKRRTARLIFDIESAADGDLIAKIRYSGEKLTPTEAVERYRAELLEHNGKDFIPYTFQLPVSLVVATVADDPLSAPRPQFVNLFRLPTKYHKHH